MNCACQLHFILNTLKQPQNQDKKELISNYGDSVDFVILLIVGKQKHSTPVIVKEPHKYNGGTILAVISSRDITKTYLESQCLFSRLAIFVKTTNQLNSSHEVLVLGKRRLRS